MVEDAHERGSVGRRDVTEQLPGSQLLFGGKSGRGRGASMLLAALRGYAGCEVLAMSNWLLHRDDQIGCLVFSPIDQLERRLHRRTTADRRWTEASP